MLARSLTGQVLEALHCPVTRPDLRSLNRLLAAYVCTVPWESASRIAKRACSERTADCPRWPDEFWAAAIAQGCGGTCFESNYAFFALLQTLGYRGYLTINNMGERIGCHTAMVVTLEDGPRLADVGMPIYRALRLDAGAVTRHYSAFHTYVVRPDGAGVFQIERTVYPRRVAFTLVDRPVDGATYCAATERDYGESGLFLDRVIVHKVIGDQVWRFGSHEQPYHLEALSRRGRFDYPVAADALAAVLAARFGMDETVLAAALAARGRQALPGGD